MTSSCNQPWEEATDRCRTRDVVTELLHSVLKNGKGQVDRLRILLIFVFFVPVKDFFLFLLLFFQDIDFLWYIASSDNVLKTPA